MGHRTQSLRGFQMLPGFEGKQIRINDSVHLTVIFFQEAAERERHAPDRELTPHSGSEQLKAEKSMLTAWSPPRLPP